METADVIFKSICNLHWDADDIRFIYAYWRKRIEEFGCISLFDLIDLINILNPINPYDTKYVYAKYIWTKVPSRKDFIRQTIGAFDDYALNLPDFDERPYES